MKHIYLKLLVILAIISLFMACTGFGNKVKVKVVLLNINALHTGSTEKILLEQTADISGSGRTELYAKALKCLREKNLPADMEAGTAFKNQYKINYISESCGEVTVDFSSRNLTGTEMEERLLIAQIVGTLTGSFEEVERVFFTVDGETAETLMGHVSIAYSFASPLEAAV